MQLEATFPPPQGHVHGARSGPGSKDLEMCLQLPSLPLPSTPLLSEASLDTYLQSGLKIKFSCSTVGLWDGVTPCSPIPGPPERLHVIERP